MTKDPFGSVFGIGLQKKEKKPKTVNLGLKRCMVCGKTAKQVGKLERAHILAETKGGMVTALLCHKHHTEYDDGKLSEKQVTKLNISWTKYRRYRPNRGSTKIRKPKVPQNPFEFRLY